MKSPYRFLVSIHVFDTTADTDSTVSQISTRLSLQAGSSMIGGHKGKKLEVRRVWTYVDPNADVPYRLLSTLFNFFAVCALFRVF